MDGMLSYAFHAIPGRRPMLRWFGRLPLTLRMPLAVAIMIFVVATGTTQLAIQVSSTQFERQMERIGQVYLDGLSAALLPAAMAGDVAAMTGTLRQALTVHVGIEDRRLLLLDSQRRIIARADRTPATAGSPERPWPAAVDATPQGTWFEHGERSVWVWRPIDGAAGNLAPGTVVALLDVGTFIADREQLRWILLGVDLLISAGCALLGFALARRLQRPVTMLTSHLQGSIGHGPRPLDTRLVPGDDPEIGRLVQAFNRMAADAREREAMLGRLVEQEREAVLGRMSATLAHEVRNPLGGMSAAIQTLRRFGDRPTVRDEALDFLARGVAALQEVTDATLRTHRPGAAGRPLARHDLDDIARMVRADAARRNVSTRVDADIPDTLPVAATEVRQLLLNLLLNAVRATAPGGQVLLRARRVDSELRLDVQDEGPGLSPEIARGLAAGEARAGNGGLGVAVVVRMVEQLQGRVSVDARAGGGTRISLFLPLGDGWISDATEANDATEATDATETTETTEATARDKS